MIRCRACLGLANGLEPTCPECGETLLAPCAGCGAARVPGLRVCARCGDLQGEPEAEAEAVPGDLAIESLAAFRHPLERRAFLALGESPGLFALARARRAGAGEAPEPLARRPVEVPARLRAICERRRRVGLEVWADDGPGIRRLGPGRLRIGMRLEAALAPGELGFLLAGRVFAELMGVERYPDLVAEPWEGGGPEAEGHEALSAWLRFFGFSSDRFALAVTGVDLAVGVRAVLKEAALASGDGGRLMERLRGFSPGEDQGFDPYRRCVEGLPGMVERVWELYAFARSPLAVGLAGKKPWERLGSGAEDEARTQGGEGGGVVEARVAAAPTRLPVPAPAAAVGAWSGGGGLWYLSAYRKDLRIRGGGRERSVDLSGACRLPSRLAVGPGGEAWVLDAEGGSLVRLDRDLVPGARFDTGVRRAGALAVDSRGRILVADRERGSVVRFGPDGRRLGVIDSTGMPGGAGFEPVALTVADDEDGEGPAVWVADRRSGRVLGFTAEGSLVARLGEDVLEDPVALALGGNGLLFVLDGAAGRIERFDATGRRRGSVRDPEGPRPIPGGRLAIAEDGSLLLLDATAGRVLAWDPELRPLGEIEDLVAPEDRFGWFGDLVSGPVPEQARQESGETGAEGDLEEPCVRSISS